MYVNLRKYGLGLCRVVEIFKYLPLGAAHIEVNYENDCCIYESAIFVKRIKS